MSSVCTGAIKAKTSQRRSLIIYCKEAFGLWRQQFCQWSTNFMEEFFLWPRSYLIWGGPCWLGRLFKSLKDNNLLNWLVGEKNDCKVSCTGYLLFDPYQEQLEGSFSLFFMTWSQVSWQITSPHSSHHPKSSLHSPQWVFTPSVWFNHHLPPPQK